MDFAKAAAEYAKVGTVNIPTSISTCAPFTCMSVMYTPEGGKKDCWRYEHELDAVLVDMQVIADCPIRYTAAGILDAMAKRVEIQNGKPVMTLADNKFDLFSAFRMAEYTYEVLEQYGPQAVEDNRHHKVTKALEDVTFINVAVTGVIANITKSFSQSAIGHSMYDGIRTLFTKEAKNALHGEIVAVALFTQLHYGPAAGQQGRRAVSAQPAHSGGSCKAGICKSHDRRRSAVSKEEKESKNMSIPTVVKMEIYGRAVRCRHPRPHERHRHPLDLAGRP